MTVETAVFVQPSTLPVTVYVVVTVGDAVAVPAPLGVAPELHAYVVAPEALRLATSPAHIVGELTVTTGKGMTVTVETAEAVHPAEAPVTV